MVSQVGKGKKVAKLKCAEGDWQAGRLDHEMSRKIRVGRFPDTGEPRFAFWVFSQLWPSGVLRVWIRHQGELGPDQRDHYGGPARCFGVSFSPDLKNCHCGRIISLLSTSAPMCLIVLFVSERPREGQLCHSPTKGFSQEDWSESCLFPFFIMFFSFCRC